jgi:hypothetical protein
MYEEPRLAFRQLPSPHYSLAKVTSQRLGFQERWLGCWRLHAVFSLNSVEILVENTLVRGGKNTIHIVQVKRCEQFKNAVIA